MKIGIFLLNMGGPESQHKIQPFLYELLRDKNIVPLPGPNWVQDRFARLVSKKRTKKVSIQYETLGGGSPINRITMKQCYELEKLLNEQFQGEWLVRAHLRYVLEVSKRSLEEMSAFSPDKICICSLYPFYSRSTSGTSIENCKKMCLVFPKLSHVKLNIIETWYDFDPFWQWIAKRIHSELRRLDFKKNKTLILFSTHGLPVSFINNGDPYYEQIVIVFEKLKKLLMDWRLELSFQSKFGHGKWLEPYTEEIIKKGASEGVETILMVPLGFVAENLETLVEMDQIFADLSLKEGVKKFARLACPNSEPEFIKLMTDLIKQKMDQGFQSNDI